MGELKSVFSSILSEYSFEDLSHYISKHRAYKSLSEKETGPNDIFLGLFYPVGCGEPISQWLFLGFEGSIVLHSPESPQRHPHPSAMHKNVHYFGPVKRSIKMGGDLLLTYMQTTWWAYFQQLLPVRALIYGENRRQVQLETSSFLIYAQGNCVKFREIAAWQLSKLGVVHYGGKCQGLALDGNRTNLKKIETGITLHNWRDNARLYSKYRFCLVMEHEKDHSAYITEKILLAFIGGCIPIYYGPSLIFDIFNKDAFVFYNISDDNEVQRKIHDLETNRTKYKIMTRAPILAKGVESIEKYFSFSDNVGKGYLREKIRRILRIPSS